jgi:porin-like protein
MAIGRDCAVLPFLEYRLQKSLPTRAEVRYARLAKEVIHVKGTTLVHRAAMAAVLIFVSCVWTGSASADIDLVNSKGWRVYTNGRLDGFFSYTFGDGFPSAPPGAAYSYLGGGLTGANILDNQNKITSSRVRSGFVGNISALGMQKDLGGGTTLAGYFALWTAIETNHNRFVPVYPEVRESYLKVSGPWGGLLVGRTLGLFGKTSVEIDYKYGHGNGLGYPCVLDATSTPGACGQIGFGVLFPFYSAGIAYTFPSFAGLALTAGVYDPVILAGKWELTPWPRFEGQLAYDLALGATGKVHAALEGLWQRVAQPNTPGLTPAVRTEDARGVAGGLRVEAGPIRVGVAGHYGTGLGFNYALEDSAASAYIAGINDPVTVDGKLRNYFGYYGQVMLVLGDIVGRESQGLGRVDLAGGYGVAHLVQIEGLDVNRTDVGSGNIGNPGLPKEQAGINGVVQYHIDDNLVADVDYFRANFSWWDGIGKQSVNTINAGLTMIW